MRSVEERLRRLETKAAVSGFATFILGLMAYVVLDGAAVAVPFLVAGTLAVLFA